MIYKNSLEDYIKDLNSLDLSALTRQQEKQLGLTISKAEFEFRKCVLVSPYGIKRFYDFYKERHQIINELRHAKPSNLSDKEIKSLDELISSDKDYARLFSDVFNKYEEAVEKLKFYRKMLNEKFCSPDRRKRINARISNLIEEFGDNFEEIYCEMKNKKSLISTAESSLVKSNLRFVISIAKRYWRTGIPISDLVGEGNLGLMHAIKRFDPEKDTRLTTFAYKCIKHRIERAISQYIRVLDTPEKTGHQIAVLRKIENEFKSHYGREPDNCELAERANMSVERVSFLRNKFLSRFLSIDKYFSYKEDNLGLNGIITYNDKEMVGNDIPDVSRRTIEKLLKKIEIIDPRMSIILIQRFGLNGSEKRTLKEIGKVLGINRERVRQLEKKALRQLKILMRNEQISV